MTFSDEITNLVKIKLISGQHKVDIVRELNVSVRMDIKHLNVPHEREYVSIK